MKMKNHTYVVAFLLVAVVASIIDEMGVLPPLPATIVLYVSCFACGVALAMFVYDVMEGKI